MNSALKKRVTFITIIFGSFGYIISKLVKVENTSWDIAGVAMLLSLACSLIVSGFSSGKKTKAFRIHLLFVAVALFVIAILFFYLFQIEFTKKTVLINEFDNDTTVVNRYFKGFVYQRAADSLTRIFPYLKGDDNDLLDKLSNKPGDVWTSTSIRLNEIFLSIWYFLFVLSLISCLTVITELPGHKRKVNKPSKPTKDQEGRDSGSSKKRRSRLPPAHRPPDGWIDNSGR